MSDANVAGSAAMLLSFEKKLEVEVGVEVEMEVEVELDDVGAALFAAAATKSGDNSGGGWRPPLGRDGVEPPLGRPPGRPPRRQSG